MIGIVDYGMGNLRSVQKGLERVGANARICTRPEDIAAIDRLILPGVGAFRDAIGELQRQEFIAPIQAHINAGKPFLGICLGLQLLFDVSFEDGEYEGLKIVPGQVVRFKSQPDLKIPHMGWNNLNVTRPNPLLAGIEDRPFVYFVHSYHVVPKDRAVVAATTDHGGEFVSMIWKDNIHATQFHPEKSQRVGLKILENFSNMK
jgi:glutamine amidotransferase